MKKRVVVVVVVEKSALNRIYNTENSRSRRWEVRHHSNSRENSMLSWTFDAEAVALLDALPGHRVSHAALVHAGIGLAHVVEAVSWKSD